MNNNDTMTQLFDVVTNDADEDPLQMVGIKTTGIELAIAEEYCEYCNGMMDSEWYKIIPAKQ